MVAIVFEISPYNTNSVNPIRVACIGDSITEDPRYTSDLQSMLGPNYIVRNYGVSGSTVLIDTHTPYIFQNAFRIAKKFLPDMVIVMLGTNDARTDNFKSINNFVADYRKLISRIQAIESNPKIFLVKPPPIFDNELELKKVYFRDVVIPRIEQVANELGLYTIDVYSALENHPEYFQDGVHPNNEGATLIAEEVYKTISLS